MVMNKNIGIISLGLIGGSLLKVLCKKGYRVTAVTRNVSAVEKAKIYTPYVSDDITTLKDCGVVFVCSPMSKTLEVLDKLESILKPETIVSDVSSLKEFVMKKKRPYIFIGSHPMAGTENSGFDASFDTLFEGAKWVLTPFEDTRNDDIELLTHLIESTGAKAVVCDAVSHDKAAALISHMPMLVAQALMKTAIPNDLAITLASSGFRDMTRLALSNTQMAEDMVSMNSKNISETLIELIESARNLLQDDYRQEVEKIKDFRKNMYSCDGKNIST